MMTTLSVTHCTNKYYAYDGYHINLIAEHMRIQKQQSNVYVGT